MKIAAFNIQRFGLTKVSNPDVLSALVKIVSRYDIIVILEVVDVSGAAVELFVKELNRDDMVDLVDCYQYEDNQECDMDAFTREPYILHFKPHNTVLKDIVLIPVRTTQWDTEKELDELYDVFLAVKAKWKTDNVMILGDFNADGKCVTHKGMKELRIRSDKNFHWLIGDDVDTTSNTANAHTYDRIVVYGDDVMAALVPQSAKPFNFHREFSMTEELAQQVSDRYPVEVELSSSLPFWMTNPTQRRDVEHTLHATVNKALPVNLQADLSTLQKENLLLEREKLQLEISILKHHLTTLSRKRQSNKLHNPEIFSHFS
ncbi:deoxyribonuclease-1-like isoform X2 [Nerophis ophidion]|uniref:deoxyribonuclease-1-like isoform X2 n=1 Tax=Nerophis ophidion TaxID=159077 RepID=UPI002ADF1382|nr:deoxyribonuclease-1-like isoform X2 [Nerophis ophidion]